MLTRFYVDNFRALVNFELPLSPRQLLMGRNGTGKSTLCEVLTKLKLLHVGQYKTDDVFGPETLTRWQRIPQQRFELDVRGPEGLYRYSLTIEHRDTGGREMPRTRVTSETVQLDGNPLFRFTDGQVQLYRDDHSIGPDYPFDWGRSALATIVPRPEIPKLNWFRRWLEGLTVINLNPKGIWEMFERDEHFLNTDASNFAAWYHAASTGDKKRDRALHDTLTELLPGFEALNFEPAGPGRWILRADFAYGGARIMLRLSELSDGQRSLIILYTAMHFLLVPDRTVLIDEPDNYVSLDEIQPWLLSVTDKVDSGEGQLLLISHHPEIFNQWAAEHGLVTERDGCGPIRVRPYAQSGESGLTPAESVARGWAGTNGPTG